MTTTKALLEKGVRFHICSYLLGYLLQDEKFRRNYRHCRSDQGQAPVLGLVAYRRRLGDSVRAGEVVAEIINPLGETVEVLAETDGLLFARHSQPYAWRGKVIGKIAGATPLPERTGHLLTD